MSRERWTFVRVTPAFSNNRLIGIKEWNNRDNATTRHCGEEPGNKVLSPNNNKIVLEEEQRNTHQK